MPLADILQVPDMRYLIDQYCCDLRDSIKEHDLMPFAKTLEANVLGCLRALFSFCKELYSIARVCTLRFWVL